MTDAGMRSDTYYEDQKPEALRRSAAFVRERIPKFLGYLERVLQRNGGAHLVGDTLSYVDLSVFQVLAGLRYAFPKAMARVSPKIPRLVRLPFNESGIFRHYPELDADPPARRRGTPA
jgi:glutathione S-transferase